MPTRRFPSASLVGGRVASAVILAVASCSSPAQPKGQGAACELVSDCQEGLVCVTQSDGTRRCTSDLSGIVSMEEAGAVDAGTRATAGGEAGSANDAASE